MPKGTTHAKTTLVLAASSGFISYHFGYPLAQVFAITGGSLLGLILTPDLDINKGCISDDIVRRIAGKKAGHLWELYWRPYSLMLPHRSRLSHFPVISTAIRLLYASILPALIWWLAAFSTVTLLPKPVLPNWFIWAFGGLVLSDTLHFLLDTIF